VVSKGVGVSTLLKLAFLLASLVDGIVHEYLPRDVSEAGVEASCNQNAAISDALSTSVTLKLKIFRNESLRPQIFSKVILQNHLRVI
jgi:hypothetical protein